MQQFGKHLMQTHKMLFLSSGATVGGAPQGSDLKRLEFHYKTDILLKILAEGVLKVDFETNFVEENSLTLSILLSWEASVFPTRKKKKSFSVKEEGLKTFGPVITIQMQHQSHFQEESVE